MFWRPGEDLLVRDVYRNRVRSAVPVTVVEHNPRRLVVYLCEGTRFVLPADWNKKLERDFFTHPGNVETVWTGMGRSTGQVMIMGAHDAHAVFVRLPVPGSAFDGWYVNLQSQWHRSRFGIDFTDHMLDLLISANCEAHMWKDENEFAAAQAAGALTRREAEAIRAEGERVLSLAQARLSPFDEVWSEWRPAPGWTIPELPDGWDRI